MIKLLLIYIVSALIIWLIDHKVIRNLPKVNRWFTYILLVGGMVIFTYSLQVKHVMYPSVWLGRWLSPLVPY
ncbi:hypothetical protein GRF59_23165 [Paenibacillus sp. HJL G12]|uniref:Uncharacterized protein n=1 Tax=Paenibacillus dendrobii TaxID=2691084 RepID=A0A7X3IMV9_9BACL|nr:hypothetical protein [Paenibacillus dendrobii]MWV46510.1 hypothetical protein [Paenibacillus dendrobii]